MLANVAPLSALTCHWTVGGVVPLARAVNCAVWPATRNRLGGCCVVTGGETLTVMVTENDVAFVAPIAIEIPLAASTKASPVVHIAPASFGLLFSVPSMTLAGLPDDRFT